ncbi:MAG: RpiB/LacA/LacB family sugar-phosphate isomerase [Minisyncoccia bacterium]
MPKLFVASDHAGFALKETVIDFVRDQGYDVEDFGAFEFHKEDDYPDFMTPLARKVAEHPEDGGARGIIIGGSGQGEAMCVNRIRGVRAAVFYGPIRAAGEIESEGGGSEDGYDAVRLARRHNDANVLSLGARFIAEDEAREAIRVFLDTPFSDLARHARRLSKF